MRAASLLLATLPSVWAESWPRGRHAHCAVAYKHYMLVYGGSGYSICKGVRTEVQLSDVWAFNLIDLSWQGLDIPTVRCTQPDAEVLVHQNENPGPRAGHTCVVEAEQTKPGEPGSILVFGGGYLLPGSYSDRQFLNDVWRLELRGGEDGIPLSAQWMRPEVRNSPPSEREGHSSVVIDGRLYVFGGCLGWSVDAAYGDLWELERVDSSGTTYEWHQIVALGSLGPLNGSGLLVNSSVNVSSDSLWPDRRCWHIGLEHPEGLLISGGRAPYDTITMGANYEGQEALRWRSLADTWLFRPRETLVNGSVVRDGQWTLVPQAFPTSGPSIHRSHHAGVFHEGQLLIHGGLWTDISYVTAYTTYIVRDLLWLSIPPLADLLSSNPPAPVQPNVMSRGPIWVYDQSMIIAPASAQALAGSAIVYGGKGEGSSPSIAAGMGIFESIWIYSVAEDRWVFLNRHGDALAGAASFVSSLLFGTVGFILYTCVIVCVFMRKLVRARRDFQSPSIWSEQHAATAIRDQRQEMRGIPQATIDELPRRKWAELQAIWNSGADAPWAKTTCGASSKSDTLDIDKTPTRGRKAHQPRSTSTQQDKGPEEGIELVSTARCSSSIVQNSGDQYPPVVVVDALPVEPSGAASEAADSMSPQAQDADEEAELCSVCLCNYDDEDVLIQLPCAHVFHEACISRWLLQDSSCPHCRQKVTVSQPTTVTSSVSELEEENAAQRTAARRRSNEVEAMPPTSDLHSSQVPQPPGTLGCRRSASASLASQASRTSTNSSVGTSGAASPAAATPLPRLRMFSSSSTVVPSP